MELSDLQKEFLEDHRVLIADLKRLIAAVESGDADEWRRLALALDRDAGPHMTFEEEVLYPRLAEVHGDELVARMVSEHEVGHRAVTTLLAKPEGEELEAGERARVLEDLQVALGHLMSCGTLLSELKSSQAARDARDLDRLEELRQRAGRWSGRSYERD